MTPRQKQCLDFIARHIGERGTSPSYREIAAALGLASTSSVSRLVVALIDRGHLFRETGCGARKLVLVLPANEARDLIGRLDGSPTVYGETQVDPNLHRALRDFLCNIAGDDRRAA